MQLSLYTFVRNGLYLDFHVLAMLRHHLPLADEIIVLEGFSTDGTYEAIKDLDPKIRIHRSEWGDPQSLEWYCRFKNEARRLCQGDWCLYLDCDEFLPEWQFELLRKRLAQTQESLLPVEVFNFYGNYRVYHIAPEKVHWPSRKMAIHRNRDDIEFWGDGSNVRIRGQSADWPTSRPYEFHCHHFGFVRHAARLREKWRTQSKIYSGKRTFRVPAFVFDLMPHRWDDKIFLPDLRIYPGPFVRAVLEDPDEFTRDGMKMARLLEARAKSQQV